MLTLTALLPAVSCGIDGEVTGDPAAGGGKADTDSIYRSSLNQRCGERVAGAFDYSDEAAHGYDFFAAKGEQLTFSVEYEATDDRWYFDVELEIADSSGARAQSCRDQRGRTIACRKVGGSGAALTLAVAATGSYRAVVRPSWSYVGSVGWARAGYSIGVACGGTAPLAIALSHAGAALPAGGVRGHVPFGEPVTVTVHNQLLAESGHDGMIFAAGCGQHLRWQRLEGGTWSTIGHAACDERALKIWPATDELWSTELPERPGIWRLKADYGLLCSSPTQSFLYNRTGCRGLRTAYSAPFEVRPVSCEASICGRCLARDVRGEPEPVESCQETAWQAICYTEQLLSCEAGSAADGVACGWRVRQSSQYDLGQQFTECMSLHHGPADPKPPVRGIGD